MFFQWLEKYMNNWWMEGGGDITSSNIELLQIAYLVPNTECAILAILHPMTTTDLLSGVNRLP
jgi:hypothetical protein